MKINRNNPGRNSGETGGFGVIHSDAPKLLAPLTAEELAEALVYFTAALDEAVDAVFLARSDPGFLTAERAGDLRLLQETAQVVAETAAIQLAGRTRG